jgi:hypothetical protein
MRVAHLILAHKAPAQLERLINALAHPQADVYIHLDKKSDFQKFAHLVTRPNVWFTRVRLDVKWGGYSLTQASLEGMREILGTSRPYDFINLLSGEDYPIKPAPAIHAFLARHVGHSFLEYEAQGSAWWQANASRFSYYHFTEFSFRGRYVLQRVLKALLPRRRPPLPVLYGGNMGGWYTLSRECAAHVLAVLDAQPRLPRFFRFTWGSDEFVVQSIVLNSPLAPTVINNNQRFIDWSGGGHSPKVLTTADLPALLASPRLYARKFDARQDAAVLDELDQALRA